MEKFLNVLVILLQSPQCVTKSTWNCLSLRMGWFNSESPDIPVIHKIIKWNLGNQWNVALRLSGTNTKHPEDSQKILSISNPPAIYCKRERVSSFSTLYNKTADHPLYNTWVIFGGALFFIALLANILLGWKRQIHELLWNNNSRKRNTHTM